MRVVITNCRLKNLAGSEMNCLEFGEYLRGKGHDVCIVTPVSGDPIASHFHSSGIPVYQPHELPPTRYDLIWGQHYSALTPLLQTRPNCDRVMLYTMSPFEPLETPPDYTPKLSAWFCNSEETLKTRTAANPELRGYVLPNMAPSEYFNAAGQEALARYFAVVSNHIPLEVNLALDIIARSHNVQRFGEHHTIRRITPRILAECEAVITIGKTVQYCMAQEVPVYVYDTYGGPGYLTVENIERAAAFNFSGRCCKRKLGAEALADEILNGTAYTGLCRRWAETYNHMSNFGKIIDNLSSFKTVNIDTLL